MTPYAELLVRPTDDDAAIRKAFHALSRTEHPDLRPSGTQSGVPGPRWAAITAAYGAVKTEGLRKSWAARMALWASRCTACNGSGVTWKRTGGDRATHICAACAGEGRTRG